MWFPFALSFAITSSLSVVVAKRIMKGVDEYKYLFASSLFTIPFLFLVSLIFFPLPRLDSTFWVVTSVGTGVSVIGAILVYRAIRQSEISLVNPISAFNPVFTALFSFLLLGEVVGKKDFLGIATVVVGAYFLQLSKTKKGIFAPIRALILHPGVRLSFVGYLLWAITPAFEKTAILHTFPQNPAFAALIGQIVALGLYTFMVFKTPSNILSDIRRNWKMFLIIGFLSGLGITLAFVTFTLTSLGIATAVFKLSMIFIPVLGWIFFKERDIKERLLGSFVMLIGVILLVT